MYLQHSVAWRQALGDVGAVRGPLEHRHVVVNVRHVDDHHGAVAEPRPAARALDGDVVLPVDLVVQGPRQGQQTCGGTQPNE